jgi:hypothetical protein
MECVFNAGFWVDGFMPRLLVDRRTGAVTGVRRPHPLDEFYPPPPGTPGA